LANIINSLKAVLLNDTSANNHYGCKLVIDEIYRQCLKVGIEIIHSVKLNEDWQEKRHVDKIKQSQIVIVNGEGTMHDSKRKALKLASSSKYCLENGVTPFLINSVYQNNSKEIADYTKMFEYVFVRESESQKELLKEGIESKVVPDIIFGLPGIMNQNNKRRGVIFTDSAINEVSNKLYHKSKITKTAKFITMQKVPKKVNKKTIRLKLKLLVVKVSVFILGQNAPRNWYNKINEYNKKRERYRFNDQINNFYVSNLENFLKLIVKAELIVTGRFHMVCLAMLAKTPFVAFPSNTFKIEGMLNDAGLNHRLYNLNKLNNSIYNYSHWQNDELEKIENYIAQADYKIENMFQIIKNVGVKNTINKSNSV